jgi:hypothetical protein
MSQAVFFPYGLSNFAQVATQNYIYVDKTPYVELLEKQQTKFNVYLRPRRFGKSLFVSLLEYYYDLNRKERFDELFSSYYIGKNPTPLANSYRILFFNFSGIDTSTAESSKQGFNFSVTTSIKEFCKKYAIFTEGQVKEIVSVTDAEEILTIFFKEYPKNAPTIYLLIDEYDHFTNEILVRSLEEFKQTVSMTGYVRKFYEVIKNATQQGVVDRFFITGVSPMALDSLTSGFNIVKHISHEKKFEAMMGFSEEEVRNLLLSVLEDQFRETAIMQDLKRYYNGYRFFQHSQQNVYNSDMVLYFLDHFKEEQTYPSQMLDPNIMPDYGKLKRMFEVANWRENVKVLEEVLEKGNVSAEHIYQFSFENGFGRKEFINFLFYLGNLTIQETDITGTIIFKIPNKVIADLYWQYYAEILQRQDNFPVVRDEVQMAVVEMARTGNYQVFFDLVQELFGNLSNRDFLHFDEKHIKMALIAYLIQANIFWVQSEREIAGGGYVDIELFIRPNNPYTHHQFAIELKYLKKEQAHLLSETMEEAKQQILSYYQKDTLLPSKAMLHLLAVVVVKDEVWVEEVEYNK